MISRILKKLYKKLIYGYKSSTKSYIKYLRKKGIEIGNNVTFYEPNTNYVDTQKPWLVKIGDNVEITRGVVIITHDYSWSVIKKLDGRVIGSRRKVQIGNNVFIGMNSIIMQGVTIGNNVIIGANSVVNKDIPSNSVVAGNPARIISDIKKYTKKREEKYLRDAEEMFLEYYKKYTKLPEKELFDEFFWIFEKREDNKLSKVFLDKMQLTGNFNITKEQFLKTKPYFDGYEEFVKHCLNVYKLEDNVI
ncbi:MAG: acyltransferase [Clostridia bacterium]|nr:acyltransferase [Clostridia bacterium]